MRILFIAESGTNRRNATYSKAEFADVGCGEGGIRTHDTRKGIPLFESGAFNHSATSPRARLYPVPGSFDHLPRSPYMDVATSCRWHALFNNTTLS